MVFYLCMSSSSSDCSVGYCMYKGQKYSQGQKWDDGCQYKCECKDARSGLYKCDERYKKYLFKY